MNIAVLETSYTQLENSQIYFADLSNSNITSDESTSGESFSSDSTTPFPFIYREAKEKNGTHNYSSSGDDDTDLSFVSHKAEPMSTSDHVAYLQLQSLDVRNEVRAEEGRDGAVLSDFNSTTSDSSDGDVQGESKSDTTTDSDGDVQGESKSDTTTDSDGDVQGESKSNTTRDSDEDWYNKVVRPESESPTSDTSNNYKEDSFLLNDQYESDETNDVYKIGMQRMKRRLENGEDMSRKSRSDTAKEKRRRILMLDE